MKKIFIVVLLLLTSLYAVEMGKSGGCTLTQSDVVKVGYNDVELKAVKYTPSHTVGKNFRELFVGAQLEVVIPATQKTLHIKVLDYKPNKRIKGKPKTGLFMVKYTYEGQTAELNISYIFNKGKMKIFATLPKNIEKKFHIETALNIWMKTDVTYSLCHVK